MSFTQAARLNIFAFFVLNHAFLISLFVYFSSAFVVRYDDSVNSLDNGVFMNATANLDITIQIIKNDSCPENLPLDCEDVLRRGHNASGIYKVLPQNRVVQQPIEVYCDMETDGGGWTVIQRRENFLRAEDYFYKDWDSYKVGFGKVDEDFWLGNDNIFGLSNQKQYSVRFDLRDVDGDEKYALYDSFWIEGEENKYMLHITDYSGDAGDSMADIHNGMKFSTKDQKNDKSGENGINGESCAQVRKGGWWYQLCALSNLNGLYYYGKRLSNNRDGIIWSTWKGSGYSEESLEWTEIKIRSKNFRPLE